MSNKIRTDEDIVKLIQWYLEEKNSLGIARLSYKEDLEAIEDTLRIIKVYLLWIVIFVGVALAFRLFGVI